ncbi:MAG: hypothetical protein GY725_22775 [bacterium]|nr:hypothetical protein [bacterium]
MSPTRVLILIVFPAIAGLWIHFSVNRVPEETWVEGSCKLDLDDMSETPPVGASNQWGQHTPRRVSEAYPAETTLRRSLPGNSFLDSHSSLIGSVEIGERVFVAPFASIRAGHEFPVRIGDRSNVQDGAVVHALGASAEKGYEIDGRTFAVYLGNRVSVSAQAMIHGPAWIEDDVFIGMQSLVSHSRIGVGSVIEPAARVIGVEIPPGRYVSAGSLVSTQEMANSLPRITFSYDLHGINREVVSLNTQLAESGGTDAAAARKH